MPAGGRLALIVQRRRRSIPAWAAVRNFRASTLSARRPETEPPYNQSPQVANIPTAAAAITKVANQPSVFSSGFNVN